MIGHPRGALVGTVIDSTDPGYDTAGRVLRRNQNIPPLKHSGDGRGPACSAEPAAEERQGERSQSD